MSYPISTIFALFICYDIVVMHMDNYIIYNEIGKLIKKARQKKGLTQEELAKETNYSHSFIANIESNTFQSFSIHTLYNIAKVLDIPITHLLPDQKEIVVKGYELYCNNCNYNVSIPKELGKITKYIGEISSNCFTCPNCEQKNVTIKKQL